MHLALSREEKREERGAGESAAAGVRRRDWRGSMTLLPVAFARGLYSWLVENG